MILTQKESCERNHQEGRLVRNSVFGSGKFHLTAAGGATTLCGVEARCGSFPLTAARADYERISPERICKRCRKLEDAS